MEQCPNFDDISRFVDGKLDYQSDEYKHISECPKCKKLVKACRQADYAARHHLQDFAKDYDVEQMVKKVRAALEKEAYKKRKLPPIFMKIAAGILIAAVPLAIGYRYLYNEIPINAIEVQDSIALLKSDIPVALIADQDNLRNEAVFESCKLEIDDLRISQATSYVAQSSLSIEDAITSSETGSALTTKEEIESCSSKMKVGVHHTKAILPTKSVTRIAAEKALTNTTPKCQTSSIRTRKKAEKKSVNLIQKVDSFRATIDTCVKKDSAKSSR